MSFYKIISVKKDPDFTKDTQFKDQPSTKNVNRMQNKNKNLQCKQKSQLNKSERQKMKQQQINQQSQVSSIQSDFILDVNDMKLSKAELKELMAEMANQDDDNEDGIDQINLQSIQSQITKDKKSPHKSVILYQPVHEVSSISQNCQVIDLDNSIQQQQEVDPPNQTNNQNSQINKKFQVNRIEANFDQLSQIDIFNQGKDQLNEQNEQNKAQQLVVGQSTKKDKAQDTLYQQIADIFQSIKNINNKNQSQNKNINKDLMIQKIVSNIQNYKYLLSHEYKMGTEQQKLLIRRFETNGIVKLFLPHKIKNHKILQFFTHIQQSELNLKSILSINLQLKKWDAQSIIKAVGLSEQKIIQNIVAQIVNKVKNQGEKKQQAQKDNQKGQQKQTQMFFQFFVMIQPYVFDILSRKIGISQFTKKVNKTIKLNMKLGKKVGDLQILSTITAYDFLIVAMKMIKQKQKLGWHLDRIQCPIPIYLQTDGHKYNWMRSLLDLQAYKKCCIISNFGTTQTIKTGKSILLSKIFNLKQEYISNSFTIFRQKTIDIFTNLGYELFKDKQTLIADINGQFSNRESQFKKIFEMLIFKSTILSVHVNIWEIQNKKTFELKQLFQKKKQLQSVSQIYFFIRDVKNQKDVDDYAQFYGKGLQLPQQILKKSIFIEVIDISQSQMEKQQLQSQVSIIKTIFMKHLQNFDQQWKYIKNIQELFEQQKQKIQKCQQIMQSLKFDYQGQFIQTNFPNIYNSYRKYSLVDEMQYASKHSVESQHNESIFSSLKLEKNKNDKKVKSLSFIHFQKQQIINSFLIQKQMSQFISAFKKQIIRNQQFESLKHINFFLSKLKVEKTQPLRKKYILLSQKLRKQKNKCQQIQKQLRQTQNLREDYDVSLMTVINQFILMNQDKHDIDEDKQQAKFIRTFYQNCIQQIDPINIIDGRTLQFGNKYLNQLFTSLSYKYEEDKHRPIYIISVIGAQSSAKSTLLNYLFGCKFQTSAGRCTKGVYFTIAQIQNKVIVVLDTEGLLSVSGRDKCFDHQIATLIFKISNLVIINNKGQLTSELRNLLDVCMYVLQNLYQTQKVVQFKSKKLFFVLRDQSLTSIQFQQQILNKITNTLGKVQGLGNYEPNQESLNYIKFFSIDGQNIFSLQNAFIGKQVDDQMIEECNESFGKSILGLRYKILKALQSQQPKDNLLKFYEEAKHWWGLIMDCGKNIMNLKCLYQVKAVQKIMDYFKDYQILIKTILQNLFKSQLKSIQQKPSSFLTKQIDCNLFSSEVHKQIKLFKVQFQKQCEHITKSKECFKDAFSRMDDIQYYFCCQFKSQFLKIHSQKKNNELIEQFNKTISNLMNQIVVSYVLNDQIIRRFQKQAQNFIKKHQAIKKDTLNNLSLQSQSILKIIETQWLKLSESHLNLNNIFKYISEAKSLYQDIQKDKQSLRSIEKIIYFPANIQSIYDQFTEGLNQILLQFFQNLERMVKQQIKSSDISQIQTYFRRLESHRIQYTQSFQKKFNQIVKQLSKKQKKLQHVSVSNHSLNQISRGFIAKVIDQVIIQNKKKQLDEELKKLNIQVQKWRLKIKTFVTNNSSSDQKIKVWMNSIKFELQTSSKKQFKQSIIQKLQSIKRLLNPESILDLALSRTYLWNKSQKINQKERIINCYKMVADTNKYLFQILCEQNIIKNMKTLILKQEVNIQQNLMNKIHQIIKTFREPFEPQVNQNKLFNDQKRKKIIQITSKYGIIFQKDKQKTFQVANFVATYIQNHFDQILLDINKTINYESMKNQINNFIKKDLKNVIIGCQALCPNCKAKCCLPIYHKSTHKVKKNCHVLSCFGGCRINKTNAPSYEQCFTKLSLQSIWVLKKGQDRRVTCLQRIKQKYPQWYEHFPKLNQQHKMQNEELKRNYEQIWGNISKMIIKYRHKLIVNDHALDKYIKNYLQLSQLDMQRQYDIPLSDGKQQLKDYWRQIK